MPTWYTRRTSASASSSTHRVRPSRTVKAISEAVFERIDVLGATDFTFTLTAAAKARGWDAAFGPGVVRLEHQGGRGKTSRPGKVATCPETGDSEHEEGQSGRARGLKPPAPTSLSPAGR